uniref:Uncharacterized protein n=1 Tax=Poecilia formosa TaxID=48698 RepID=A0A096LXC1_POEFO
MNTILLIAVLVLAVGGNSDSAYNPSPCMRNPNNNAYSNFVRNHILKEQFVPNSEDEWKTYLKKYKLCDRPRQSFVDKGAENRYEEICNGSGRNQKINLCTSTSPLWLHDLIVNTNDCSVTDLYSRDRYVTVACDKVDNRCLPVHFESSQVN